VSLLPNAKWKQNLPKKYYTINPATFIDVDGCMVYNGDHYYKGSYPELQLRALMRLNYDSGGGIRVETVPFTVRGSVYYSVIKGNSWPYGFNVPEPSGTIYTNTVTVTGPGTYTLTYKGINCSHTYSKTFTVEYRAL